MSSTSLGRAFALSAGTICGHEHRRMGRNNQDACAFSLGEGRILALVCDGCGSGRHSEVGAQVGARLLLSTLSRRAAARPRESIAKTLERTRKDVLRRLAWLTRRLGGPRAIAVRDYLLFTVIGVVIDPRETVVFALGDGLVALNGELVKVHYGDNAPPYLSYGLISEMQGDPALGRQGFSILARCPTLDLDSLLIATDGLGDLSGDEHAAFWRDDLLFKNPQAVQRRLRRLGQPRLNRRGQRPRLADDTTVVVIRRRPEAR